MKKYFTLVLVIVVIALSFSVLNIPVSIQQCINYKCYTLKLPLYLKVLDFFDRHYNYKHLAKAITDGVRDEETKVMRIFTWTYKNIRRLPAGFPVIDDHIWYTIVRGYAVNDQFSDIFTTLCNYAGINAFFSNLRSRDKSREITLSFVEINGRWIVFDPYNGSYFKNSSGNLANAEEFKSGNDWKLCRLNEASGSQLEVQRYNEFFVDLPIIEHVGLTRANIQSPLNRLLFQIKRLLKK